MLEHPTALKPTTPASRECQSANSLSACLTRKASQMYTLAPEKKLAVIASLLEGLQRSLYRAHDWRSPRYHLPPAGTDWRPLRRDAWTSTCATCTAKYVQADEIWTYVGQERQRTCAWTIRPKSATSGYSWRWTQKPNWCRHSWSASAPDETTYVFLLRLSSSALSIRLPGSSLPRTASVFYDARSRGCVRRRRSTSRN